jgi:hypothetical protein
VTPDLNLNLLFVDVGAAAAVVVLEYDFLYWYTTKSFLSKLFSILKNIFVHFDALDCDDHRYFDDVSSHLKVDVEHWSNLDWIYGCWQHFCGCGGDDDEDDFFLAFPM